MRATFAAGLKMFLCPRRYSNSPKAFAIRSNGNVKPAKLTLIKTLAVFFQNIKFCKAQSRLNF